ncbi:hypothetical protein [Streptomyces sp. NPDC047725]|uniref:hypothetical protein n=1 Tax=Streptomyces sp. NPDC047725 TaxID=3365487 RepID=UPI00371EBDB5
MTVRVPLEETALDADRVARELHCYCAESDADGFVRSVTADLPHRVDGAAVTEGPDARWAT